MLCIMTQMANPTFIRTGRNTGSQLTSKQLKSSQVLSSIDLMKYYCAATGRYAVYFSGWHAYEPTLITNGGNEEEWDKYNEEKDRALIFLNKDDENYYQVLFDGEGFTTFSTTKEMQEFYDKIVGDDGPTKSNPYDGPIRVYALTCGPEGFLTENT